MYGELLSYEKTFILSKVCITDEKSLKNMQDLKRNKQDNKSERSLKKQMKEKELENVICEEKAK